MADEFRPPSGGPSSQSASAPSIVVTPAMTALTGIGTAATGYGTADSFVSAPVSSPGSAQRLCPVCGSTYPNSFNVCPREGAKLVEAPDDPLVGQTLCDSYSIVRVIGEGGMGRVYEARHTRIGSKRFAVKMLHPEYARQPDVLSRFQREAEAAAQIKSPHVVDVYDVNRTSDGRPFIVGEFLEGKEFADLLQQIGKMPVPQAVRIVRQVCKALATAHSKGVVHRDMKPENVFLTGDMQKPLAKVIDFGISKVDEAPGGKALTRTGMIMGTPSYMAPEQARGLSVDHRADIYAVGAMLYCALTGKRPFDHGDPAATLMAVLSEEPERPRALEPSIPEPLEMVIQRAMAKEPKDRQQSMAELDVELAPWDPGEGDDAQDGGRTSGTLATTNVSRQSVVRAHQEATMARPLLALLTALGAFFASAGIMTTVASIFRISRGGNSTANITGSEAILLLLFVVFGLGTPLILFVNHLRKTVWSNTVKAIELAARVRRPVVVGLCGYGFGSLLVRLVESVILRRAVGVAWPVWDVLLLVISVAAGVSAHLLFEGDRKANA